METKNKWSFTLEEVEPANPEKCECAVYQYWLRRNGCVFLMTDNITAIPHISTEVKLQSLCDLLNSNNFNEMDATCSGLPELPHQLKKEATKTMRIPISKIPDVLKAIGKSVVMQVPQFEELLQVRLAELPYTKHLDDGQYNDGQAYGFESGARWAYEKLSSGTT